jgi:hypothetical protein
MTVPDRMITHGGLAGAGAQLVTLEIDWRNGAYESLGELAAFAAE